SAPGPSPTNTNSALGFPSAKTMVLRVRWSLQRVQSPISSRTLRRVSFLTRFMASNSETSGALGRTSILCPAGEVRRAGVATTGLEEGFGKVSSRSDFLAGEGAAETNEGAGS